MANGALVVSGILLDREEAKGGIPIKPGIIALDVSKTSLWASNSRNQLSSSSSGCMGGADAESPIVGMGDCLVCDADGDSNAEVAALVEVGKSILFVEVLLRRRPGSGGGKVYKEINV